MFIFNPFDVLSRADFSFCSISPGSVDGITWRIAILNMLRLAVTFVNDDFYRYSERNDREEPHGHSNG